ncbi:5-methyltetrahydropteroyltriglutamate-homocysteine S-methyltransferase [Candidatus Methylobacter favarea]|uniref:5-methyltetrahydropteroyltriglutamate--homocysteine methyltransferase n=1 Tax=Candidatus Methylobacter favarea TaxID=2707345 RepID=A0A8S0WAY4_9GAMM|nr:5-methyltetrahydropteroyltriglutamate--homocysteine S-methyltransferase [Candidatus Methylobacter favarea]CAA9891209.1 5-methyltetrahydropteroyltriglutamate-homocysteine S-methyltransferase [Candidatus Methylobacter favarea]
MARTHILGYPRMGAKRELKFSLEAFWKGELSAESLQTTGQTLRAGHWKKQQNAGLSFVTAGDFSFYDHVLDHSVLFGAAPGRFGLQGRPLNENDYFSLARGNAAQPAMEMTKWFDTNYHFIVPELDADTVFSLTPQDYLKQLDEALAAGFEVKPVLLGPVSYLYLGKSKNADKLDFLDALAGQYAVLLNELQRRKITWLQIDEPILALDLDESWLNAFDQAYSRFKTERPKLLLTTYFDSVARYQDRIAALPVDGIHLDLVRAPEQLETWLATLPEEWVLSAGVIDGRNIWRNDLDKSLALLAPLAEKLGERLWIAPSCSLLHTPVTLAHETLLDSDMKSWLAFADEKLEELRILAKALDHGAQSVADELAVSRAAINSRAGSGRVHSQTVKARLAALDQINENRAAVFPERQAHHHARLNLPLLPTSTIGSFPQTAEIRASRAAFKKGDISPEQYDADMKQHIQYAIRQQEQLGLDVLVHGEAERNDMVEYFGEQLAGYVFTQNGWVQSYGSRCVKPPVIYGDVYRPSPMTVDIIRYAQSLTGKPVKGMLTGPVTMLQWSFVRDDQPRETTALQLALAIRDEVDDLQKAGIAVIQIDEPAFREGLPLQRANWAHYLAWAVRAFKLASSIAGNSTQIHTHMCYSEFNDILQAIAKMDADVITIETSRSRMELLDGFGKFSYPNEIGPGIYDIHSPRIPSVAEMEQLMRRAMAVIPVERLWINPDCGLKTRGWPETRAALQNMVDTARNLRSIASSEKIKNHIYSA